MKYMKNPHCNTNIYAELQVQCLINPTTLDQRNCFSYKQFQQLEHSTLSNFFLECSLLFAKPEKLDSKLCYLFLLQNMAISFATRKPSSCPSQ